MSEKQVQSILCMPGYWNDSSELVQALVKSSNGKYLAAGNIITNLEHGSMFEYELCDADEDMTESFEVAGMVTRISDTTLNDIEKHTSVIYLKAATGSIQGAEALARAGGAILRAGGLGIKVETAGKAFDKEVWLDTLDGEFTESDLYQMFVIDSLAKNDGTTFSCGMHNLGLKDTIISGEDFQYSVQLIRAFSYYQIVDKPAIIEEGQTFAETHDAPSFVIKEEANPPYAGHELFSNPLGTWRLRRK